MYSALFGQIYPLLQQALVLSRENSYVVEKICRSYKYAMRSMNQDFQPFLPSMTHHLAEEFAIAPIAAFLYGASICVAEFGKPEDCSNNVLLVTMIQRMTASFFSQFTSLEMFEKKPDIIEEFFYLMAKILTYSPLLFLQSQQDTMAVYEAGIVGLQVKHRDAHRGILTFFEKFALIVSPSLNRPFTPELKQAILQKIVLFGGKLVAALLLTLSGDLTVHTLGGTRIVSRLFLELRNVTRLASANAFQEWVAAAVLSLQPIPQKVATEMSLQEIHSAPEDEVTRQLDRFFLRNKQ